VRGAGERIGDEVIYPLHELNITSKLRDVGQLAALPGRPSVGCPCQGVREWLVVGVQHELAALQEMTEVADPQVADEKISVESRVFDFGSVQLL